MIVVVVVDGWTDSFTGRTKEAEGVKPKQLLALSRMDGWVEVEEEEDDENTLKSRQTKCVCRESENCMDGSSKVPGAGPNGRSNESKQIKLIIIKIFYNNIN